MAGTSTIDGATFRAWVEASHAALVGARARLDHLNVFPVADADTGTNLLLTFSAGRAALADLPADAPLGEAAQAVSDGALIGARGNSGIILSQYLRALGEAFADQGEADGGQLAFALDRAALSATAAMAEPVEGTALTVVKEAADAARRAAYLVRGGDELPVAPVAGAAVAGARVALAQTPSLLAPLAERGVVDAGGAGFVLLLQALKDVVTGEVEEVELVLTAPGAPGEARPRPVSPALAGCAPHAPYTSAELEHWQAGDYEVMYVLTAGEEGADLLRHRLARIGTSVGVVGGVAPGRRRGLWHVHVHTDSPVDAVVVGRAAGDDGALRQVVVRHLRLPHAGTDAAGRLGVVAVTRAPGLLAALAAGGAVAVLAGPREEHGARPGIARAMVDSGCARVAVLPCDEATASAAGEAVALVGTGHGPVGEVLPTLDEASVVSAVVAHGGAGPDPAAARASMIEAISRSRAASVPAAAGESPAEFAARVATATRALLGDGGDVVTVIVGRDVPGEVVAAVERAAADPAGADVVILDGGQDSPALILGVE